VENHWDQRRGLARFMQKTGEGGADARKERRWGGGRRIAVWGVDLGCGGGGGVFGARWVY